MGIITLEKANHLFWLGRYTERMTGTIRNFMDCYDKMIDVDEMAYVDFCHRLSIDSSIYTDSSDFIERFVYDISIVDSLASCINYSFDNAVVLRDEIKGDTLAYIDLAKHILNKENHGTLILELQRVLDYVNAFWGSLEDNVEQTSRSIIKCGKHAEKLDIQLRFEIEKDSVQRDLSKLIHRLEVLNENYSIKGLAEVYEHFKKADNETNDYLQYISELTDCFSIR